MTYESKQIIEAAGYYECGIKCVTNEYDPYGCNCFKPEYKRF